MEIIRHHFPILDSTNNCAKRNVHLFGLDELTMVTAGEQTAGRGRYSNSWVSPAHENIYVTFCFFLPKTRSDLANISQLLAVSTAKALIEHDIFLKLKWPNDLLMNEKKVGGILCETKVVREKICVICGLGLNVNMNEELFSKISQPVTSLMLEKKHPLDTEKVLKSIEREFRKNVMLFLESGFSPFLKSLKELLGSINKTIRFHDDSKLWEGVFHSINDDGSLNLLLPSQQLKRFYAGQIVA
ncbi:MAG: hypothetical protein Tsb0021_10330 [Chlamydiales bacterium]